MGSVYRDTAGTRRVHIGSRGFESSVYIVEFGDRSCADLTIVMNQGMYRQALQTSRATLL